MNKRNLIKRVPASLAITALLLSACGAQPSRDPALDIGATAANSTDTGTGFPNPFPTTTFPSPVPTDAGSLPAITTSFTLTGSGGSNPSYSFTVDTDNLLKVRITAGAASNVIPGSNFSANYGCVTYQVSAVGQSVVTQTLGVSGANQLCPNAPESQTIDFSSRLTPGHHSVNITVTASGYDFYCQGCLTYPWLYNAYPYGMYSCNMYCPLHTVFKNHGVTGSMAVQVNGTTL